jgi:hypothetical protein
VSIVANVWLDPLEDLRYEDVEEWIQRDASQETDQLDFKQDFSPSVTASIVGMGNHDGGFIIVGVAEQPEKDGPAKTAVWPPKMVSQHGWQDTLTNHCFADIRPTYAPLATFVASPDDPDRGLIIIRVDSNSAPRPLWHKDKGVLWRLGDQNRPADLETLRRLFGREGVSSAGTPTPFDVYRQRVARANRNGCWLGVVVAFPWACAGFDSTVKRRLIDAVYRRWPTPSGQRYTVDSASGTLALALPAQDASGATKAPHVEFQFDGRGIVTFQSRTAKDPVRLAWVVQRMSQWLSFLVEDPAMQAAYVGRQGLRVQLSLSPWPSNGITPDGLFTATRVTMPRLKGHGVVRQYGPLARSKMALVEAEGDFCRIVLDDAGYLDHEAGLARVTTGPYFWDIGTLPLPGGGA